MYIIGLSDDAKNTYQARLWFMVKNRLIGHSNETHTAMLRSYDEKMSFYALHNMILYV